MEKNYVTKEEFKAELEEIVKSGKTVWAFLGAITTMVGLFADPDISKLVDGLIENGHKDGLSL